MSLPMETVRPCAPGEIPRHLALAEADLTLAMRGALLVIYVPVLYHGLKVLVAVAQDGTVQVQPPIPVRLPSDQSFFIDAASDTLTATAHRIDLPESFRDLIFAFVCALEDL